MKALAPSHKDIMFLIYMRTILELCVRYDDNGNVKEHVLTPTAWGIYNRIAGIEKCIYNQSQAMKVKYIQAHELCKPVWEKSLKAMGENYSIYIEPLCASLYSAHESSLKKLGLISSQFMFMYDQYFLKHNCDLEVESVKPIDVIVKETEKVIFEFKKQQKRKQ